MRAQTFRVWDKRYKRYVKPYAVCLDGRAIVITEPSNDLETLDSERVIIEFGTGLKDQNGKEIHEGDIVTFAIEKFDSETFGYVGDEWHTAVVKWDNAEAGFYLFDGLDPFPMSISGSLEIQGNINENPELLETK